MFVFTGYLFEYELENSGNQGWLHRFELEQKMIDSGVRQSESLLKLIPALIDLSSDLKSVQKSGVNTFQRYKYASLEDYFESVTPEILQKHGFVMVTSVADSKRLKTIVASNEKGDKKVTRAVEVRLSNRLIHKTGEWIEVDSYGEGNDAGDKAVYKAITGARKYGIALLLRLVTTDDPEKDEKEVVKPVPKKIEAVRTAPKEAQERLALECQQLIACENEDDLRMVFSQGCNVLKPYPELLTKFTEQKDACKRLLSGG